MSKSNPFSRLDFVLTLALFVFSLLLYLRTLAPGLLMGDGAELQTLTYTLGLTHPTGYPIYLLLSRLFAFLPIGDLAWRVNLFSALATSLTVAQLYLIAQVLNAGRLPSLLGPLVLAIVPVVWWHAVMAEVYALAAAFVASIVLLVLLWRATGKAHWLFVAALLGGASIGVHGLVALLGPATVVYLVLTARRRASWLAAIGGALVGILITVAGFMALSLNDPPSSYFYATVRPSITVWGLTVVDISTAWGQVRFLLEAQQFDPYMFADPLKQTIVGSGTYLLYLVEMFPPAALVLMVVGVIMLGWQRWREATWLLFGWGSMLFFVANYDIWDIEAFYVPTYVLLALLLSLGSSAVVDWVSGWVGWIAGSKARREDRQDSQLRFAPWIEGIVGLGLAFAVLWSQQQIVIDAWQRQKITFLMGTDFEWYPYPVNQPESPRQQALRLVARLEPNAIVFTEWGMLYPYYFVAHVEKGQTDMAFYEKQPQGGMRGLADTALAMIERELARRPIYFDDEPPANVSQRFEVKVIERSLPLYQVVGRR